MNQRPPISAIITCYNEQDCIAKALHSVAWADELVVVDSFSTDQTIEIVRGFEGVKLLQRPYLSPADQKNWATSQAKHQWVFILDADEQVSEALRDEILQGAWVGKADGFWIRRMNYFMGKRIRFSGWQNDKVLRLFDKAKGQYNAVQVHEEVMVRGRTAFMRAKLTHFTYKDLKTYLEKFARYTTDSAKDRDKKTGKIGFWHLAVKPMVRFVKQYFFRLGVLDGRVGFVIASMAAYSVFLRYLKLWRNREEN